MCGARTKGRFPENMPGPLQYGNGILAFVINLPISTLYKNRLRPRPEISVFSDFFQSLLKG